MTQNMGAPTDGLAGADAPEPHAGLGPSDGIPSAVARAICRSGKFETGHGTCAAICMGVLGCARDKCSYPTQVHGDLARAVIEAAQTDLIEALETARDMLLERIHGNPARSSAHNARVIIESALRKRAA